MRPQHSVYAVGLACLISVGCGAAPGPVASSRSTVATAVSPAPGSAASPPVAARRHEGPLTRGDVEALLAEGIGAFLARVEVSPVLARGRFVGFRLDAAQDLETWRTAGADIRVGDVILRVNGIRIERPEQALWAFERLRIVDAVEVTLLRDGAEVTVRHPILEAAARAMRE